MSNEINLFLQQSGWTVYVVIQNKSGQFWNTSSEEFESFNASNWADYDVSLTEQGSSGIYLGDFPTAVTAAGTYPYYAYRRVGGTPAQSDTRVGNGSEDWTGTASASAASGAMTASDWRDYVLRGGFKRTNMDTEIYEATTDAIQELRRRFDFDEAQVETTTTDTISSLGDFKIEVESDLGLVLGVIIEDGTDGIRLGHISKNLFDERYPDINVTNDRGYPKDFTIYDGHIYIGPIPDQTSYSYRISYSSRAGTITSTTAAVPFTNLYRDALRDLVNYFLYESLDAFDKANYYRDKFERKFVDMTRRERQNQGKDGFATQYTDF
jgi:hypothetical protein